MALLDRLRRVPAAAWATMRGYVDTDAEITLERPGYVELVFSLVLVWGFGDAVSTLFAAQHAGAGAEVNPWIRILLETEPLLVLALKMAVVLYVGIILLECRPLVEGVPYWRGWLLAMVLLGVVVVLNNTVVGLVHVATMV